MVMKSWSVETLNNFVMDNFIPYAWCNMWEETNPGKDGIFYFRAYVNPNTYARTNNFYRSGVFWEHIPAACSLEIPDSEFYQSYVIQIPMLLGDSIKGEKKLEDDPQRKFKYWKHLAKQSIRSLQLLDLDDWQPLKNPQEIFGNNKQTTPSSNGWEKVAAYVLGKPREQWTFISESK
jgi:hypothetical protein